MSSRELRRHAGRFVIAGFAGHTVPDDLRRLIEAFDLAGVIYFATERRDPLPGGGALPGSPWAGAGLAVLDQRRSGGRTCRPAQAPFTIWPPAMTLGRSAQESLATRYAARAGDRTTRRGDRPGLCTGARHPHQSRESRDWRSRHFTRSGRRGQAGGGRDPRPPGHGRRRVRQALSRSWRHERRLASRRCRWSSTTGGGWRPWSGRRSAPRSRPRSPR